MRLALIFICVFFISATGQTAQTANSDHIVNEDIISLQGFDIPYFFCNDCQNTQQTAIDSHSVSANGYLIDDCLFTAQPETALLTYDHDEMKQPDYFDDDSTKLAGTSYLARYARAEISTTDNTGDGVWVALPNPGHNYFGDVVSWIVAAYRAWVSKDHYGSTGLVLLSFGLVGLIGIRRKFKKD